MKKGDAEKWDRARQRGSEGSYMEEMKMTGQEMRAEDRSRLSPMATNIGTGSLSALLILKAVALFLEKLEWPKVAREETRFLAPFFGFYDPVHRC